MVLQYAITDGAVPLRAGKADPASDPEILAFIARCTRLACDGLALLLVREKHLPAAALTALTRSLRHAIRSAAPGAPTRILVSGRADIALAAGADGVHLSAAPGELTPTQVRTVMPKALVSVSCHTLDEVRRARDHQASLALFAPVFGKRIHGLAVTPAAGLEALQAACRAAQPMPVFALGGVTAANAPHCLAAGAAGVAGIRMFFHSLGSNAPV